MLETGETRRPERIFNAPTIVVGLIAALVIIHTIREWLSFADDTLVVVWLAFIPVRLTDAASGFPGGQAAGLSSMVTHALLHADWLHLTMNGAWLLAFGTPIARRSHVLGFLALFAGSAIAGAVLFWLINPNHAGPLVGASGGISGLMGAAFRIIFVAFEAGAGGLLREHPEAVPRMPLMRVLGHRHTLIGVGLWLGVNLVFGLGLSDVFQSGQIAWEAHVGGFLFGFALFAWFDRGRGGDALRY